MSHFNQCLANAKRGLSLWKAANICLWWYKSGYSERQTESFASHLRDITLISKVETTRTLSGQCDRQLTCDLRASLKG